MKVSVTVKREFMEEALDSTGAAKVTICKGKACTNTMVPQESEKLLACVQENVENLTAMVDKFFEGGEEVYRYVSK